jgi:antitoxin ParD1/3/4
MTFKTTIGFTAKHAEIMKKVVASGRFATNSEFVRAAVAKYIDEELNDGLGEAEALRAAWEEGISSGPAREVDFEALKAAGRKILKAARR